VATDAPILDRLKAVRSVYTRCHVTDKLANFFVRDQSAADQEAGPDHGAAFCVQDRGALLVGYVPLASNSQVRTIKSSVVFPCHFGKPDEVWHGDREVTGMSASFDRTDWTFVRDGDIYLAFHAVMSRQQDQMLCVQQYALVGDYLVVSAFNVCDFAPHEFSTDDLRSFGGGFIVEVGSARDYGSFGEFVNAFEDAKIEQRQWGWQREIRYRRGDRDLEIMYDYRFLTTRRAAVASRLVEANVALTTRPEIDLRYNEID
jgi:hypothetical protein